MVSLRLLISTLSSRRSPLWIKVRPIIRQTSGPLSVKTLSRCVRKNLKRSLVSSCQVIGCRCLYTKSNPIDDHSNISWKKVTEAEFQTIGPLYLHAVWYLPFTNSPRKHTVTYHFSDLQEVYSGNGQIHTKCQLQYLHPPQISTSGKGHCVIIHQTTKPTEYIG